MSHASKQQIAMLSAFMEKNPEVAKSYNPTTASGRVSQRQKWEQLARSLNSNGPPTKSVTEWKRVWTLRKYSTKKKLTHNKTSLKKTGGGPFDIKPLDETDEAIVNACGMEASVSGIVGGLTFGSNEKENQEKDLENTLEELLGDLTGTPEPVSNILQEASTNSIPSTPRRLNEKKQKADSDILKKQLALQEEYFSNQTKFSKEANETLVEIRDAIRELSQIKKAEMEAASVLKREELKMRQLELEVAKVANDLKLMDIESRN